MILFGARTARALILAPIFLGVFLVDAERVAAARASCTEIIARQTAGKSAEEVAAELGTTTTRVEACARIAEARAHRASHLSRIRGQRAVRAVRSY